MDDTLCRSHVTLSQHIQRPLANTDLFRPSPRHPFDENFSFIATINDDQRFHLNDFETPISKETVSDDLETHDTFIFIYYNKSDDCFEPLGNDWKTIVKIEFCKWIKRIFFLLNFWIWYNGENERIFGRLKLIWSMFIWRMRMFENVWSNEIGIGSKLCFEVLHTRRISNWSKSEESVYQYC